jgi:non-specific serine/threonine protein kinase
MEDVFAVQDEIAQKIAEALRITLSPQEHQALAAKPTENPHAYDLYLRGRNYARRVSRQDLQVALQMFESATALDPEFAVAHAGLANVCVQHYYYFERNRRWIDRAVEAFEKARRTGSDAPEVRLAEAWLDFAEHRYSDVLEKLRSTLKKYPDLDGGYYLLGSALFESGQYHELIDIMEDALSHAGENYNTMIPIANALGALGKTEALTNFSHRMIATFESHVKKVPEDARARVLLANAFATLGRFEESKREADLAMALRPDDTMILYNTACVFCLMKNPKDALAALKKACDAGYSATAWARQDPDLAILHGDPEFESLFQTNESSNASV